MDGVIAKQRLRDISDKPSRSVNGAEELLKAHLDLKPDEEEGEKDDDEPDSSLDESSDPESDDDDSDSDSEEESTKGRKKKMTTKSTKKSTSTQKRNKLIRREEAYGKVQEDDPQASRESIPFTGILICR